MFQVALSSLNWSSRAFGTAGVPRSDRYSPCPASFSKRSRSAVSKSCHARSSIGGRRGRCRFSPATSANSAAARSGKPSVNRRAKVTPVRFALNCSFDDSEALLDPPELAAAGEKLGMLHAGCIRDGPFQPVPAGVPPPPPDRLEVRRRAVEEDNARQFWKQPPRRV